MYTYILACTYRFEAIMSVDNVAGRSGPALTDSMFFPIILFYDVFRLAVGRQVRAPLWGMRAYVGGLPMTYDLEGILKYRRRYSYDLRS